MKIVSKSHIDDSNCSCGSCLYRSESDRPSLRNLLTRGSRIDRLYYGKYIPLREKKLIDRLVRTRAVYNDIRAQLLSDSTASLSTKPNFVLKNKLSAQHLQQGGAAKSGSILKIVGMVDKGEMLSSKNISECCSCCSCSSKIHAHNRSVRKQRHKHPYSGVRRRVNQNFERYRNGYTRKKGVQFKAKHIRSDPCTCTFKFSRLLKNHSKTMLRKLYTDTQVPVDLQAMTDEEISKKRYKIAEVAHASYHNAKKSIDRVSDAVVEGIKKLNESKSKIRESFELQPKTSLKKLNKGKEKVKNSNKNEISNKNDARICECPEIDFISHIKKDSVGKFKDDLKKKRMLEDWECETECIETTCDPEECFIKLRRKRPHIKIREHRGMQERKVGVPISQSNNKVQADIKKIKPILRAQQTEEIKSRIQTNKTVQGNVPKNKKHSRECACGEKSKENVKSSKKLSKISPKKKAVNRKKTKVNQPIKNQIVLKREGRLMNVQPASERSSRQAVRIGSSISFNVEFYKSHAEPTEKTLILPTRPTFAVKYNNIGGKNNRNLYKRINRGSQSLSEARETNEQISRRNLKRCFCILKLKDRKSKPKIKKKVTEETLTTDRSVTALNSFLVSCRPYNCIKNECNSLECKKTALKNIQTDTYNSKANRRKLLLPYQCEPGICIPDYCDPHRCIKITNINNAKIKKRSVKCSYCPSTSHSRKTKSTSSLTSRSYAPPKAKYVQSVIAYTRQPKNIRDPIMQRPNYQRQLITSSIDIRQAVRIGSTFSFNIEFYKDKSPDNILPRNLRNLALKHKPTKVKHRKKKLKTQGLQKNLSSIYLTKPSQMTKKDRKTNIGLALKRCFCTLKLQGKKHTKDIKRKMLNAGTEATINSYLDVFMINRSTKIDHKDLTLLEPFECKPFACIPGECDPYVCLEKIKNRSKKLKDAGIATKKPLMAIESSTMNSKTFSKTIQTHHLYSKAKHEKTINKQKNTKGSIRKIQLKDKSPKNIRDKKSVNIGSTFSFAIEFSKSRSPMTFTQSEKWPERMSEMTSKNNAKHKKTKINTRFVNENIHKASMINPFLKRCFCTLNLQKKRKQDFLKKSSSNSLNRNLLLPPIIYTINAMTEEVRSLSYFKIFKTTRSNSNQLCIVKSNCEYKMSIKQFTSMVNKSTFMSQNRENIKEKFKPLNSLLGFTEIGSKLSTDKSWLKTSSKNNLNKTIITNNENGSLDTSNGNVNECIEQTKMSSLHLKQRQSNHAIHYFKKCFYVMNLHLENNNYKQLKPMKMSKSVDILKNNKKMQLMPYECVPGICVPGECNPYECQKLVLKRTMKNNSTKIGAKNRKSISNNTKVHRSKSTQNNKKIYVKTFTPKNNKDLSDYSKNRVVRIGSSFDFNIQFSKSNKISRNHCEEDTLVAKLLSNTKTRNLKEQPSKSLKSVRRRIKDHKYNIQSQSGLASITHRASMILPMFKRCSCTLKLHKKGRLHKKTNLQELKSPYYQNIIKIHTNSRGQHTKKMRPLKTSLRLEPYECEPNICDPGNCEPYRCFEIMKSKIPYYKTKESGTETILYKNKSMHSMTSTNKSKSTQKKLPYRILQRDKVRPKLSSETDATRPNSLISPKQVVRVGSSFSFNIEFLKDRAPCHNESIVSNKKDFIELYNDLKDTKQKHSAASIEYSTKNKKSQMQSIPQIVKRCFCTSKLYQNKKKYVGLNLRKNAKPSFFKKCLCWLKQKKCLSNVNKGPEIHKNIQFDKKTIFQNNMHSDMYNGRYDCEPGICVLGKCELHECDAIRRKRLRKRSQSSTSPYIRSRSTHTYGPTNITKNAKTQSIVRKNIKHVMKPVLMKTSSDHTKKQLVRIGSNFSFNIEFYKSNMLKRENLNLQQVSRKLWHNRTKASGSKIKKNIISVHSRYSQAMLPKKNNHSIGINNIMKRCFCTLQFYNKSNETKSAKAEIKSVISENSKLSPMTLLSYECEPNICIPNKCDPKQCDKIIQTRKERYQYKLPVQAKLLPYECEPHTCIPGQCNPIKCLGQILKRQNESKHIGTAIDAHNRYTISTMTKGNIKPKNKRNQSEARRMTLQKIPDGKLHAPNFHKQAVRIGSKFSFDIEFYKDNVSGSNRHEKKKNNITPHTPSKSLNITKRLQRSHFPFISSKIQVPHVEQKEKKPVVLPFLKKCFCIFKLHNKETKRNTITCPIQLTDQNYERHMNNKKIELIGRKKMLPFECEPNVCLPSLCDPYECEKRIQKRIKAFGQKTENMSSKLNETDKIGFKSIKSQARKGQLPFQEPKKKSPHSETQRYRQANGNKEVYCIGSTFSYDVEFFKNRYPKSNYFPNNKYMTNIKHIKTANNSNIKLVSNYLSDSKQLKERPKSNYRRPYLKRCFCTLKLQKRPLGSQHHVTSFIEPKMQRKATKSNGTTCSLISPHACDKRIQVKSKSRNISSQVVRLSSDKYTRIKAKKNNRKIQKNYINKVNDFSNQNDIGKGKRIVDVPRFANGFDKQAVKIGSNFNFHIDFYKHTLTQPRNITFSNDHKKSDYVKKKSTSIKPFYLNNLNSKTSIVHSKDKGMEAENILKRCLCTLKLQNTNSRPLKTNRSKTPYYPQVVEVRRVSVLLKPKIESQKEYTLVKAKAKKSIIKYKNQGIGTQCLYSFCQHCGDNNSNNIHIIYPYVPKKFDKTSSITLISKQNIPIDFKAKVDSKRLTKKKSQIMINLTKGLKQELPVEPVTSRIKKMLCYCITLLKPKKDYSSYNCNIKQDKYNLELIKYPGNNIYSTKKHAKNKIDIKSKSIKLKRKNKNAICQKECLYFRNSQNCLQQVADDDLEISLKLNKKINLEKIPTKVDKHMPTNNSEDGHAHCKICNSLDEHYKENLDVIKFPKGNLRSSEKYKRRKLSKNSRSFKLRDKHKNIICKKEFPYFSTAVESDYNLKLSLNAKNKKKLQHTTTKLKKHMPMKKNKDPDIYCKCVKMNKTTLCSHCQNTIQQNINQNKSSPQLKVHFLDSLVISQTIVGDKNKKFKRQMICNKNNCKKNFENLTSCRPCGRRINAKEIQKAAGDYYGSDKKKRENMKVNKKTNPLFKMQLDSDDYDILNKAEIIGNVIDLDDNKIKDQSKYEGHTNSKQNKYGSIEPYIKLSQKQETDSPFICGSIICAKKIQKPNKSMSGLHKKCPRKQCVCGSTVCYRKSATMETITPEKITCIYKENRLKTTKKKGKREFKLHPVRMKQLRKEDQIRRLESNKGDEERAKKINQNASDIILLAKPATNIGQLGITACMDTLRALAKMSSDPKQAYRNLKAMKADPKLIGCNLKIASEDSGVVGTANAMLRIRLRCLALRGVKKIKTTLESYTLTDYPLHITTKDPKKRILRKKKSPRIRERLDFGCNLYMASLRKRPFLSVYDRVPWFYPHFLNLVNMYKQFRDILLFLLAVFVWSPCILCMETCRVVMCCFFCTK